MHVCVRLPAYRTEHMLFLSQQRCRKQWTCEAPHSHSLVPSCQNAEQTTTLILQEAQVQPPRLQHSLPMRRVRPAFHWGASLAASRSPPLHLFYRSLANCLCHPLRGLSSTLPHKAPVRASMAWYAYDIEFLKRLAKNPLAYSWANKDIQVFLEIFFGLAKASCHNCGSLDHIVSSCPLSPKPYGSQSGALCNTFNRNVPQKWLQLQCLYTEGRFFPLIH